MSTTPLAVSGQDSSAGSIGADIELTNVESTATESQVPETVVETPETTETQETQGQPETEQVQEDGRKLPLSIRGLKEANPEAYKAAKGAFFENLAWRGIFPNIQEARKSSDLLKSVGGAEGLGTLRQDSTFFKEAANQFVKGDPAFVKDLWDEDPIAAALHVAPMLETFKGRDIEGYKSTVARLWDQEFQSVGFIENGIKPLRAAIESGNKQAAIDILQSIEGWRNSISDVAKRAEDPRVKTLLAERAKQHDDKQQTEHSEFLKTYRTETTNQVVDEASKVFDSFFKGRKISAEDRNDLLRESVQIANRAVTADKAFIEDRDKHLAKGDSHSAQQLTRARFSRELTGAVQKVARRYGYISGTPSSTQQKPNQQQSQQQPNVAQGFTAVAQRPDPNDVDQAATAALDRSNTYAGIILSGRAVLRNGKKVDWSKLRRA